MLFQKKLDRARELQRERRGLDDEEKNIEIERPPLKDEMEKGDMAAMLVSGCFTILPVALLVLLLLCGGAWLFLHLF